MLNYGGSITSAFPNTFASSPASLTCQLCNTCINELPTSSSSATTGLTTPASSNHHTLSSSALGGLGSPGAGLITNGGSGQINSSSSNATSGGLGVGLSSSLGANGTSSSNKLEKCTHCGINICERCFNENHECPASAEQQQQQPHDGDKSKAVTMAAVNNPTAHSHYNTVKKEFKQMYNYSKEIVEKLHLLNNTIKMEESAVSELNLIKHQVNTKAIELIKQINQEKCDLIEQIENVKRKYESYVDRFFSFIASMSILILI